VSERQQPVIGIVQRTRKSPFFEATRHWGAKAYTVYNHMLMPLYYDTPQADYWKLITGVTLWDVAVERQVEISGPDAFHLVEYLTPRDLSRCQVGQCKYIPLTAEDGGLVNDPVLLRLGEAHFWLSLADSDVLLWAKGLALGLGLNVTITEPDVSPLAVQGPKAQLVMAALFGAWVEKLGFFRFRETELAGIPLVVARSGWSKQGGFELYLRDSRYGEQLWDMIMAAGQAYDIAPAAPSGIERIESGLLSYGNDMTLAHNPFEVGLGAYCDLDKTADFIGRATLRRIKAEGVRRQLVGLELAGPERAGNEQHWPLYYQEVPSGAVTSATYSPRLQKNIALAIVTTERAKPGPPLTVDTPEGLVAATVVPLPFIDPSNK
jgi:aminomethyltransferase